jgi:hypothetical protein
LAIAHFNVAIVGRSSGKSSVHAAAYASRSDLADERTGHVHRYARKGADLVSSWLWLPKDAPETLRDRAALWNAIEKAETRKNSQLARRIILALPHELTTEQQQQLLKDYVRENFTRKELAADVNIHKPDPKGDDRNFHAHILVPTRFIGKDGIGKKDRESNDRETLQAWRKDWEKKVNRQLERYGHAARISMDSLEAQGVDREPQIHLGQGASALDRKGVATERADVLRSIANDNGAGRAIGREAGQETDATDAEAAGRAFMATQAAQREGFERDSLAMASRHAERWGEVIREHAAQASSQLPQETAEEAGEAATTALSFFLSLFTSWAESITRSITGRTPKPQKDRSREKKQEAERRERVVKEQQQRELEALLQEHTAERVQFERRREDMLKRQADARGQFEQEASDKSSLRHEFQAHTDGIERYRDELTAWSKERVAPAKEKGPQLEP